MFCPGTAHTRGGGTDCNPSTGETEAGGSTGPFLGACIWNCSWMDESASLNKLAKKKRKRAGDTALVQHFPRMCKTL